VAVFLGELRDPEVRNLRVRRRVEQDVGRLDVAVDDAQLMRGAERRKDLETEEHARSWSSRPFASSRERLLPGSRSMTMNGTPLSSPMS